MVHQVIIFGMFSFYGVCGITVTLNRDITGTVGENGTHLECSYTKENGLTINVVVIEASINNTWQRIIIFPPGHPTRLLSDGSYLVERVTFNNLTQKSNKAMLIFNKLLCEDETDYKCGVIYNDMNLVYFTTYSESTRIRVQDYPSVPDKLSYFSTSKSNIENDMVQANICSTNDELLQEGDLIIIQCYGNVGSPVGNLVVQKIQNNGAVYNLTAEKSEHSSPDNCLFYHNTTFTVNLTAEDNGGHFRCAEKRFININEMSLKSAPLDVKYQVRTPIIQEFPREQDMPSITLICISTGNPTPTYEWYRMTSTSQLGIWEMYANNTQAVILTSISDSGLYRCDVINNIGCVFYRKNTTRNVTIKVVQPPKIAKMPDQTRYTEGTSIKLSCSSFDYPNGNYRWLLPDSTVFNGNLYYISNAKRSQSGVYTCLLIFTFTSEPSIRAVTEKVIIGDPETTGCQCATCSNVAAIIGSVFGVIGVCLVIISGFYFWRRSKLKMSGSDHGRQMTNMRTNDDSHNYEGMNGERPVHHYDDLKIGQEQQYYNTQIKTRR